MFRSIKRHPWSGITLLILFYLLWRIATLYPRWDNSAAEATISWDVFGYYLYLPAYFIYDDLGGLQFIEEVFRTYQPAGDFHHAVQQPNGQYVMKYPIGMAILYLPFFLLGHLFALLSDFPADGFSRPYQLAISWGSIVYAWIGLGITRNVLLRFFNDQAVAISIAVIALATNYLNYVSFDGAMPHNYLYTLYALIILLTILWHQKPQMIYAIFLGASIGLATIIRPIELMAILIPLLWTVTDRVSLQQKLQLLLEYKQHVIALIMAMAVVGFIQMLYWKLYSGHFLYYSYGEFGFDWLSPHIIDGLLSARKGWLVYTPVMIFALIGFIPLFRQYRYMFWAITAYILINIYVVYSWEVWWYGGSFGSRAMIQAYAVLSIPLALMVHEFLNMKSTFWKLLVFGSMILCTDLNLIQTWQAHSPHGGWRADGLTRKYYWKIFSSTRPKKSDKKFLDVRYELKSLHNKQIDTLFVNGFENDTVAVSTDQYAYSGTRSMLLNAEYQYSPNIEFSLGELSPRKGSWLRTGVWAMYINMEWVEWQQCQLILEFVRGEEVYKRENVHIQRLMNPWQWHHVYFEYPIPNDWEAEDRVRIYIWNATGQQAVYLDDWHAELIQPQ